MRATRLAAVGLAVALVATACGAALPEGERAWCAEHGQEVVAASYTIGGPMTPAEVAGQAQAESPSPEYVRACRAAYRDR